MTGRSGSLRGRTAPCRPAAPPRPSARLRSRAQRPSGPPSPDDPLEEVIITGLRWWLDPTQAMAPVTVLDRRDIERGGESSIGDVLQSLPMTTGSPLNANANVGEGSVEPRGRGTAGDGSVRIFLHDLPTLVLLNGRRLPSSGLGADASVDLNTLPISFIERVDVLASGASAAFGADAVGGVVNVVTRQGNRGLELSGTRTITQRGDGEIVTGQAAIGFDLLGGTWSLGLDYVEQDGVTMDRRSYSAAPLLIVDGNGTVAARGLEPYARRRGIRGAGRKCSGIGAGQVHARRRRHRPDGRRLSTLCACTGRLQYRAIQLFADAKRTDVALAARLTSAGREHNDLPGRPRPSQEVRAAGRTASIILFSRTGRVALRPTTTTTLSGSICAIASRRLVEAGNRVSEQEVDLWRALIGLEGSVARWTWELALQSAKSEGDEYRAWLLRAVAVGPRSGSIRAG